MSITLWLDGAALLAIVVLDDSPLWTTLRALLIVVATVVVDSGLRRGTPAVRPASAKEINAAFAEAATRMRGIIRYTNAPVVSRDIIGDPASCVFDAGLTQASGPLVKIFGWYDNEWGYTSRLVDLTELMANAELPQAPGPSVGADPDQ
jgi:hypothetical protein